MLDWSAESLAGAGVGVGVTVDDGVGVAPGPGVGEGVAAGVGVGVGSSTGGATGDSERKQLASRRTAPALASDTRSRRSAAAGDRGLREPTTRARSRPAWRA